MEGSYPSGGGSGSSGGIGKTKYKPMERANKGGITINPKTFVKVRSAFMNKYQNAPKGLSGTVKHGNYYYYCTSDGLGSIIINSKYKG